jgi:hypothetical protein
MDIFTLEPLKAQFGDCLILHYGAAEAPSTILIDGGPGTAYGALKDRLTTLAAKRPGGPFQIDLLMVSHIDDDHVGGLLKFTEAWRNAKTDHRQWPWPVAQLWHNTFERIAGGDLTQVQPSIMASFGVEDLTELADLDPDDHDTEAAYKVLASVGHGAQLSDDAEFLEIPQNTGFTGLVVPPGDRKPVKFGDKLHLHVVGPLPAQIKKLQVKFAKDLPKSTEKALAAYSDDSIPNLSSIVVLARYGTRTILLTGDARGDYVLQGLKEQNLLDPTGHLHVDILKMQHHGSCRNTAEEFFASVIADHYIASADGTYENPDRPTFEMLAAARPATDRYTIHLTYEIDKIDAKRKTERASAISTALRRGRTPPPDWRDEADALSVWFQRCADQGFAFRVTTPASRTTDVIDLMEPVTF